MNATERISDLPPITPPSRPPQGPGQDASDSFGDFYESMAPFLLAWAELRIPRALRSALEPEDLVQETCFRAYKGFATYRSDMGEFRSWLFGIANNVLHESLRAWSRRRSNSTSTPKSRWADAAELASLPTAVTSISKRLARRDDWRILLQVLEKLEPEDKQLLALRGIEGLSNAKSAELLGFPEAAAAKRWQRLKARLAALDIDRQLLGL